MNYVLDTSVAAAWYLPQDCSPSAYEWRERALQGDARLLTPSLHFWEFGNVLRKYVRNRTLDADTALKIYSLHLDFPLTVTEPPREQVLPNALRYDATPYDAVYISLALRENAPLLTAERQTTPWVSKLKHLAVTISGG